MTDVTKTLKERGSRYGGFSENARLTQGLMALIEAHWNGDAMPAEHKEALHMICHKISRITCGDEWYDDNLHDIAGYAKLLEEYVKERNLENGE